MIEDSLSNAFMPEDLDQNSRGFRFDRFDNDFDSDNFDMDDGHRAEWQQDEIHNIPLRACPFCHCELPRRFGCIETHHIVVYGGWASGKTAFLINLFMRLEKQLTENGLGTVWLEGESRIYLQPMIADYEREETTRPTPADKVLPIVCYYTNKDKEAFYIFHEIPSAGVDDHRYLADHYGKFDCDTLMVMIDPNMFVAGAFSTVWNYNHGNGDYSHGECCKVPIYNFLEEARTWSRVYGKEIKTVIAVITKMDMLLESNGKYFSAGNIELIQDIEDKHRGAVDLDVINSVGDNIQKYVEKVHCINLKGILAGAFGDDKEICILGVATSTKADRYWDSFCFEPGTSGKGHRIIEPFLAALLFSGLVPYRDSDHKIIRNICLNDKEDYNSDEYPPVIYKLLTGLDWPAAQKEPEAEETEQYIDDFDF